MCSLNARASEGWSDLFRGRLLGLDQLATWSRGLRRFAADRARHDPAHFIDVEYDDFVADPIGTVESIYDRLGAPLTASARAAMTSLHAEARRPSHRYDLADFGLTTTEVSAAF